MLPVMGNYAKTFYQEILSMIRLQSIPPAGFSALTLKCSPWIYAVRIQVPFCSREFFPWIMETLLLE